MTTMDYAEFRDLVERMRAAQCRYFRSRDTTVLHESKALERAVDMAIKDATQPGLFDERGKGEL